MLRRALVFVMAAAAGLLASACGGSDTSSPEDRYQAFDESKLREAEAEIALLEGFRVTLESKDFAAIETAYADVFEADLAALRASHPYVRAGDELGARLADEADEAITFGTDSEDPHGKEAAEEIVQTIVLQYEFETLFAELSSGTTEGWDRAFAYAGRSADGSKSTGLAALAAQRDDEFALTRNDAIFQAFIAGRAALASGGAPDAQAKEIDAIITEVFGLSARSRFDHAAELIAVGEVAEAVEPFAVGRGILGFVDEYILTLPGGADAVAALEAEVGKGDPATPESMADVDFDKIVETLDTVLGFDF
jgi:hypothetical protein